MAILRSLIVGRSFKSRLARTMLAVATVPVATGAVFGGTASLVAVPGAIVLALLATATLMRPLERSLETMDAALNRAAGGAHSPAPPAVEVRELVPLAQSVVGLTTHVHEATQRLVYKAFHDALTGLPNRALFMSSLKSALTETAAGTHEVAVLFFDLDRFKVINDTLGHATGDRLLVVMSQRLRRVARGERMLARLAGDEFIMLVQGPRAESEAISAAEEIRGLLRRPFALDGHELFATCSVGIAVSGGAEESATELLRKADIALYRAKGQGRSRYTVYDPVVDSTSVDRVDLDSALRRAVERDQLMLHYQPEYDLASGEVVGVEALLRWHHPHRGVLSPKDFVSLAEETGEIAHIGRWVLDQACRKAGELNRRYRSWRQRPIVMGVNISASEFSEPGLVERVRETLAAAGLPPQHLRIEITETVLMEDIPATFEILSRLKEIGVQLAIDDFGTGFSSLSYLQLLPVDTLKIDQSFVSSLGHNERSLPIVDSVVQLGRALDMQVTAEGIETFSQYEYLRRTGCRLGQGHYFSVALDERQLQRTLDRLTGFRLAG